MRTYTIRDATEGDVTELAALHVQTFRETHGSPGPTAEVRERQWRETFKSGERWFCLVVEADGRLVGFAKGVLYSHPDLPAFDAELNKIYLLRECQGFGIGRKLLLSVAERLREMGFTSMLLFGDPANRSNGFYEHMGAERLYAQDGSFHGGYGWRDLHKLV